jgi:hypothetical protein
MGLPAHEMPSPRRFPKAEIETALRSWWKEQETLSARYGDPFSDARTTGCGTVFDIQPKVSSQEAVTVLLGVGKILGYEPPTSVIKRGGYKTSDEMVQDLGNRLSEDYAKQHP